jgi:hypothetical protein
VKTWLQAFAFERVNLYRYTTVRPATRRELFEEQAYILFYERADGRAGTFQHVILQSKHQLMTAGMAHVTKLTPGSANPSRRRGPAAARRRPAV